MGNADVCYSPLQKLVVELCVFGEGIWLWGQNCVVSAILLYLPWAQEGETYRVVGEMFLSLPCKAASWGLTDVYKISVMLSCLA